MLSNDHNPNCRMWKRKRWPRRQDVTALFAMQSSKNEKFFPLPYYKGSFATHTQKKLFTMVTTTYTTLTEVLYFAIQQFPQCTHAHVIHEDECKMLSLSLNELKELLNCSVFATCPHGDVVIIVIIAKDIIYFPTYFLQKANYTHTLTLALNWY